jgi:hypothetical protein
MRNGAAIWFDNYEKDELNDPANPLTVSEKWSKIENKFIEQYSKEIPYLSDHLFTFLSQRPGESVQKYYSTVLGQGKRLKKSNEEIKTIFIRGLTAQTKMFVLTREPADLEQAYTLARKAEALQIISGVAGDVVTHSQNMVQPGEIPPKQLDDDVFKMRELVEEIKRLKSDLTKAHGKGAKNEPNVNARRNRTNAQPRDRPNAVPMIRCYYCGIYGHAMRECRKRAADLTPRQGYQSRPAASNFNPRPPGVMDRRNSARPDVRRNDRPSNNGRRYLN